MSFRLFRRILVILLAALSAATLVLALLARPTLPHPNDLYVLVLIPAVSLLAALSSALSKPLLGTPHMVAFEATGLFALLPFHLIMILVVLTKPSPALALQLLVFINAAIIGSYTLILILTALLTSLAFDPNVWYRDIDATPSPFPLPVLFAYVCPRLFPDLSDPDPAPEHQHVCLPGSPCTCEKPAHASVPVPSDAGGVHAYGNRSSGSGSWISAPANADIRRSGDSLVSLVRIPNAVERRMSIAVSLDV